VHLKITTKWSLWRYQQLKIHCAFFFSLFSNGKQTKENYQSVLNMIDHLLGIFMLCLAHFRLCWEAQGTGVKKAISNLGHLWELRLLSFSLQRNPPWGQCLDTRLSLTAFFLSLISSGIRIFQRKWFSVDLACTVPLTSRAQGKDCMPPPPSPCHCIQLF
jgi:hypothetical protein